MDVYTAVPGPGLTGKNPKKPSEGCPLTGVQFPVGVDVPSVALLNVSPANSALSAVNCFGLQIPWQRPNKRQ